MSDHVRHLKPSRKLALIGLLMLFVAVGIGLWGVLQRRQHLVGLEREVAHRIRRVSVVSPLLGPTQQQLVLPGNIRAFREAPIYARVSGYLKSWRWDIGAHVRAGDVLAEIETPELDQQILRERARLLNAQSNLDIARITAGRWQRLVQSHAVSRQEADEKNAEVVAAADQLSAGQASLQVLLAQQEFNRIKAPFDGVITQRNTDIGQLINLGNSDGRPLFVLADIRKLRIYVDVPQLYSAQIHSGMSAELRLTEYTGRSFLAKVIGSAQALQEHSRSLSVELEIDNHSELLMPGSYAEVHFTISSEKPVYRLPASTLLFRKEGLQVATVMAGRVVLKNIIIGRDLGGAVEILDGISGNDQVVENPSDAVLDGMAVQVGISLNKASSASTASAL